ncbi:hypothetical protein [Azospirillum canadense]|uniref:hypothetical protein n=1 Tax=Azospirillum canadense TaxID=403962 RepID=UPI002226025C|nr:hypothetical protein [Azospirillum canadense]MCW2243845.1 hypothetical protein [Azospirillum canadense]
MVGIVGRAENVTSSFVVGTHVAQPATNSLDHKKVDIGLLARLFGTSGHAKINITGAVLMIMVCALVFLPTLTEKAKYAELSQIFTPIITAIIGFLIGQKE